MLSEVIKLYNTKPKTFGKMDSPTLALALEKIVVVVVN